MSDMNWKKGFEDLATGAWDTIPTNVLVDCWVVASVGYEQYAINIIEDTVWDALTKELNERIKRFPNIIFHSIPRSNLEASTGMGAKLVTETQKRIMNAYLTQEDRVLAALCGDSGMAMENL